MLVTKENANTLMPKIAEFILNEIKQNNAVDIELNKVENSRSLAQNRLLWGVWHKSAIEHLKAHYGIHCSPDALHEEIVEKLGYYKVKQGLSGDVIVREQTKKMSTKRFTKLLNDYEQYALENWQLQMPHPADIYYLAMGINV